MDMNTSMLLVLGFLLALTVASAGVIARTAKSKGYSFGWFFFFGVISYLLTAVVTIFLRPKGEANARPKVSSLALLALGVVVEFVGISYIPDVLDADSSAAAIAAVVGDPQFLGGVAIAFAGLLIVIGAVANDYRQSDPNQIRQL